MPETSKTPAPTEPNRSGVPSAPPAPPAPPAPQTARRKLGRGLGSLLGGAVKFDRESTGPEAPASRTQTPTTPRPEPNDAERANASVAPPTSPSNREVTENLRRSAAPSSDHAALRDTLVDSATPIGEPAEEASRSAPAALRSATVVDELSIDRIDPGSRQPRQRFDDSNLAALAESIRIAGVMQPVIVRPVSGSDRFELVAGERRWRAAARLGLQTIPALVRNLDDRDAAEWALIENLQREDLNPMDRASAFRRLVDEFGLTHAQLAERLGVDRSSITNILRLNELDSETAEAVRGGHLGLGHAKALLGCTSIEIRKALAEQAIRQGWSVRRIERAVATATRPSSNTAVPRAASAAALHRADLERRLGEWLGTRVSLESSHGERPGRLVVEFYSIDQFEGILQRFGVPDDVLRG